MAEQNKRNEDFLDYETRFNQDTVALKKLKITEIHSEQLQGKTTIRLEIDSFTIWLTGRENLTHILCSFRESINYHMYKKKSNCFKWNISNSANATSHFSTNNECYFSKIRKSDLEKIDRPEKSVVTTSCSGTLLKMETLATSKTDKMNKEYDLSLILCRGAGICGLDLTSKTVLQQWANIEICENHKNELASMWGEYPGFREKHIYRRKTPHGKEGVCSMPSGMSLGDDHSPRPYSHLQTLTVKEADTILKTRNVLVHPGIPICRQHKAFVEQLSTELNANAPPPKKSKTTTISFSDSEQETCRDDPVYVPFGQSDAMRQSFLKFAAGAGITRVCSNTPWDKMKETTKDRKISAARKLIETMLTLMVSDKTREFRQRVEKKFIQMDSWTSGSSKNLEAIMSQISAHYLVAEDRNSRILILSLVANSVSYLTVEKYIPGLSPVVMIGLPYGVKKVKWSDGSKLEIQDSIRQQSATEIIEMYSRICEDNNRKDLLLGTSTMYKILNVCSASKREATTCVDYFIAIGMESFDGLHKILDDWDDIALLDPDNVKQMKQDLHHAAQYLRTDFRIHVKSFSRIADHCATFALSDTSNPKFSKSCSSDPNSHIHDLKCDRCEKTKAILERIEGHAKQFVTEEEEEKRAGNGDEVALSRHREQLEQIQHFKNGVLEMKKHLLRAAVTNKERTKIVEDLKENEALITLDFAQRFLPKWHREKQCDYFGKKGISYHIAHTIARIGSEYAQHIFVHIYDGSINQDNGIVVLTLAHVLKQLKIVGISKVHLRSDNAGCYHSAATIGSLHWLIDTTKMDIGSYTFSEAQNGKSASDREANRVKRRVKDYIDKGKDVLTSKQFFDALKDNPPNGMSIYHGTVTAKSEGITEWKGISNVNHFTIEKAGIRARRYAEIGEGVLMEKSKLKPVTGSSKFEDAGFLPEKLQSQADREKERNAVLKGLETVFWYNSKCVKKDKCAKEPEEVSLESTKAVEHNNFGDLYPCPEHGCSSTFLKFANLEKHLLIGKHNIVPEKMTERDYALNLFAQKLEDANSANNCPIVEEAVKELKETTVQPDVTVGWALPIKRTRKAFEPHVVQFLIDCFNRGVANKKPMNPVVVEEEMRTAKKLDGSKKFKTEELLTFRQIAGFFSREADKRRQAQHVPSSTTATMPLTTTTVRPSSRPRRFMRRSSPHRRRRLILERHRRSEATTKPPTELYLESEEEHPDAGWIRFLKLEEYWSISDEFLEATTDKNNDIFLPT